MIRPGSKSTVMQTDASRTAAVRAAFSKLIDYAGLFPPAQLAMPPAVAEYAAERNGAFSWMLGRFIVPASRVSELLDALPSGERLALSIILDTGVDGLTQIAHWHNDEPRISIEALEAVVRPESFESFSEARKRSSLEDLPTYVEFPRDAHWNDMLARIMPALAGADLGAKVRCGGLEAKAFPSPEELATFIQTASEASVPFKATAGLHHPIRHLDAATGFMMHGFLNLLAASAVAIAGAGREQVLEALEAENPSHFDFDDRGFAFDDYCFASTDLKNMRTHAFVGYGSCSFSEPVEDLRALNIL